MKTKNIFKTLALAMLMPTMLLTTACSSEDDVVNNTANTENTINKGYALPVTVNVTREGDAATRATYNESTKKLEFSTGDKLFVYGSTTAAGSFAGELDYVPATSKFSGTIYTQEEWTGTADALFAAASAVDNLTATLLPNGYDASSNSFLSINNNSTTDIAYDDRLTVSGSYAFVASETAKATGVEQLSWEQASTYSSTYSSGFALSPGNAILNFTITGLEAGAKDVSLQIHHGFDYTVTGSVTPNASGVATFAIGVPVGSNIKNMENNLTVGSSNFTLPSSTTFTADMIYNITRSTGGTAVIGHALSASVVGDVVGTDGLAYAVGDKDNLPTGVTAAAVVAYKNGDNGLAIALTDEASAMNRSTAYGNNGAAAHTPTVSGQTWTLPHRDQWKQMFSANGNNDTNCAGLNTIITNAGGTALIKDEYWTSYYYNTGGLMPIDCYVYMKLDGDDASFEIVPNDSNEYFVRACLSF